MPRIATLLIICLIAFGISGTIIYANLAGDIENTDISVKKNRIGIPPNSTTLDFGPVVIQFKNVSISRNTLYFTPTIEAGLEATGNFTVDLVNQQRTPGQIVGTLQLGNQITMDYRENPLEYPSTFDITQDGIYQIKAIFRGTLTEESKSWVAQNSIYVERVGGVLTLGWDQAAAADTNETVMLDGPRPDIKRTEHCFADENLNRVCEPYENYLERIENVDTEKSPMLYISGQLLFEDRNGNNLPMAGNLVQLVNGSTDEVLTTSYTNGSGYYDFDPVVNPGIQRSKVVAYSVEFINGNIGYGTCVYPGCPANAAGDSSKLDHFHWCQTLLPEYPAGSYDIGTGVYQPTNTNSARAFWMKYDIQLGYVFLGANSGIQGPFTVEWSVGNTDGGYYTHLQNIFMTHDMADGTNCTLMHEMGHNVMNNAGFNTTVDCPSPHYMNKISGHHCGWSEGWAHAFMMMSNNSSQRCYPPAGDGCWDLEIDPRFNRCWANGFDCYPDGYQVEGHVAGAIWDIFDNANDDADTYSYGTDEIFHILEVDQPDDFLEWYIDWQANNYGQGGWDCIWNNVAFDSVTEDCLINGVNYDHNDINPGNSCEKCNTALSMIQWSNNPSPCDDGLFCTTNDTCQNGSCIGLADTCPSGYLCDEGNDECYKSTCGDKDSGKQTVILLSFVSFGIAILNRRRKED